MCGLSGERRRHACLRLSIASGIARDGHFTRAEKFSGSGFPVLQHGRKAALRERNAALPPFPCGGRGSEFLTFSFYP